MWAWVMLIKTDYSQLEQSLLELTQKVIATTNLELYDFEYLKGSKTLRVYVCDKNTKNAVIEDCILVDNAFTPFVEEADWIPDDFVLEVSSPGVYRNLKTKEHFEAALGCGIEVKFKPGTQSKYNTKKILRGTLADFNNEFLNIDTGKDQLKIEFNDLLKANLDPEV